MVKASADAAEPEKGTVPIASTAASSTAIFEMDTYQKLLSWCQILPCENIHSLVQLYHTFSEKQAKETLHEVRHAICVQIFPASVFIVHENRLKFTAIEHIMTMERRDYHDSGYFSA